MKFLSAAVIVLFAFSCQQGPNRAKTLTPYPKQDSVPPNPAPVPPVDNPPIRIDPILDPSVKPLTISVMAYNLENLFDDVIDNGEKPTDRVVLEKKLAQVAKGILQIRNKGPDVLIVEEVENLNVLKMLRDKYLTSADYKTLVLLESNDERGIDVGIFSRLPLASEPKLHKMPFSDVNPTRGIMEATLTLENKKTLRVFGVHFPSQANPPQQRREAAELLKKLMRDSDSDYVVAGGDFNITPKEELQQRVFADLLSEFEISHIAGCQGCLGTYYYKANKTWSFYDVLLTRGSIMLRESVRIPTKADGQANEDGSPKRFDASKPTGISDHFPIYTELQL